MMGVQVEESVVGGARVMGVRVRDVGGGRG